MAVKIQLRRGTQTEFNSANPTLLDGEVALVTDDKKIIIGPGAYNDLNAAGKFINFHTDQGLGTVGGANGTSEIPIKLVGASGQAVAALQVLKNGGSNGILEVFTDNTTELVKINAADGAVDDISLLLKAKASQTAAVVEVQSSGATTPRFQVKEEGQTLIQPDDTTDPSLQIKKSSGSQSNGILRVNEGGTAEFQVLDAGISVAGTSALDGNVTGKAITTIQNGSDATDRVVIKGLDTGNVIEVFENNVSQFAVDATGKVVADDIEIDVTGRTLTSALLLRLDEIIGLTGPFTFTTDTPSDSNYNGTTEHLLPLDVASAPHDFATKTTFPNQPALTLVPISGTSASPDTSGEFGTGTGDTTNAYLLRIPANSGRMTLKITLTSGSLLGENYVGGEAKFYSYTAQTATASDNKTQLGGVVADLVFGGSTATVSGSVNVANSTVEKFVAVSFDADHNTGGSSDPFSYTFEVSRDGETVVAL